MIYKFLLSRNVLQYIFVPARITTDFCQDTWNNTIPVKNLLVAIHTDLQNKTKVQQKHWDISALLNKLSTEKYAIRGNKKSFSYRIQLSIKYET